MVILYASGGIVVYQGIFYQEYTHSFVDAEKDLWPPEQLTTGVMAMMICEKFIP